MKSVSKDKAWRLAVIGRDAFACQHCGANTCLDAAHIIPRSHAATRHDLRNGVTLFHSDFPPTVRDQRTVMATGSDFIKKQCSNVNRSFG